MLVLTRHRDQSIQIGQDIVVTIVDIRGDKIRIGVDAPRSLAVHRSEVADEIACQIAGRIGPQTLGPKRAA